MSRKLIAIAVAALLGIVAIWYVALWSPQGAKLKQAQASAATARQKEGGLQAHVASLQLQRTQVPALEAQIAHLSQAIPANASIDKVIDDVNAVVLSSGVTLSSLSPSTAATVAGAASSAAAPSGAIPMTLTVSVSGTYFQLVDFINKLNAMPRLAVVDGFSLSTPDQSGKITTSVVARVFMAPPVASSTTATTTAGAH